MSLDKMSKARMQIVLEGLLESFAKKSKKLESKQGNELFALNEAFYGFTGSLDFYREHFPEINEFYQEKLK